MISLESYRSKGARHNAMVVTVSNLKIYFSYETPVAFIFNGDLVISENIWSRTTGKHLHEINPNKDIRVSNEQFKFELAQILEKLKIS